MSSSKSANPPDHNVTCEEGKGRYSPSEGTPLLSSQNIRTSPHVMTGMFCSCHRFANRKFLVDILAIFFGISAWISINGMFMQLPLMVQTQPEGWNLPSYLSVIIQIANVGPLIYSISQKLFPGRIKDCWIIYVILTFGTIALLLMGFFYDRTTDIGGSQHSTALFVLSFFGAFVGCTSSVLFMPFMSNFREIYLISYFVGEGLSGFLPSVVGLIQGVGGNPACIPSGSNSSVLEPDKPRPRFSTEAFFFFLFAMMTLSTISFFLLNNLRLCESERTDSQPKSRAPSTKYSQKMDETNRTPDFNPIFTVREDVEALMKEQDAVCKTRHNCNNTVEHMGEKGDFTSSAPNNQSLSDTKPKGLSNSAYIYFLVIASFVCMFGNGIFPSIQSYSCLPYGNVAYHLSVALGSMANPMACFLAFFYPYSSVKTITTLVSISIVIIGYIMATALLSPVPPLVNTAAGETLVVISWVAVTGLITYIKVSVASRFRLEEGRALFWCGAVQQIGSAVGAILFFFLINYTKLFTSYYPCT